MQNNTCKHIEHSTCYPHIMRLMAACMLLLACVHTYSKEIQKVSLSSEEQQLYELVMEYRASKNLPAIPLSPSLTYVAQTHVRDLMAHPPTGECNLHSWSEYGDWTPCCYAADHAEAKKMWNKPRELTTYQGAGYEIAFWYSAGATAQSALEGWKHSPGHNAMMVNLNTWETKTWRAIGIGIYGEYAVIWFGEDEDTSNKTKKKDTLTPPITIATAASTAATSTKSNTVESKPQETTPKSTPKETTENVVIKKTKDESKTQVEKKKDKRITITPPIQIKEKTVQKKKSEIKETPIKEIRKSTRTDNDYKVAKTNTFSWPQSYYNYSGKRFMSVIAAGYSYSFINSCHLVEASLFDFRAGLFGMTLLGAEMSVLPYQLSIAYKPTISLYLPAAKCFAFVPYISANVDATYLGTYFKKDFSYSKETDFYAGIVAGLGLEVSGVRAMPLRVQVEYRHPFIKAQWQEEMRPSINVGVNLYIGKAFNTK